MPSRKRIKIGALSGEINRQRQTGRPWAVYKRPGEEDIFGIFQDGDTANRTAKGFLCRTFCQETETGLVIAPDRLYRVSRKPVARFLPEVLPVPDAEAREIHTGLVREAVAAIREGEMEKVVLARRFSVPFTGKPFDLFLNLCDLYPEAFCYLWEDPESGIWLGASPELLLEFDGVSGRTVSLAGTLPAREDQAPEWTEKEFAEQRIVTDCILTRLGGMGIQAEAEDVRQVRAGNLWHLRSEIRFRTDQWDALQLAQVLHPTPAVCGYPPLAAQTFILKNENFNREYYCGYLGEVHADTTRLYVNLRCLQLREGRAHLYIGGGITRDSDPVAEWEEIQQKSLTVLRALRLSQPD